MKNLILVAIITLVMAGCSKDDKVDSYNPYVGTEWTGVNNKVEVSLHFTKENGCCLKAGGLTLWYDYQIKNKIIYMQPEQYGGYNFKCTVSGNTMTVINEDTGKTTYILYKT